VGLLHEEAGEDALRFCRLLRICDSYELWRAGCLFNLGEVDVSQRTPDRLVDLMPFNDIAQAQSHSNSNSALR
jgi:hypothetical protein